MKNFVTTMIIICSLPLFAQVGVGTTTPASTAALEVSSQIGGAGTYRGFMPPRVPTNAERDAITPAATDYGLMVFVVSTGCLDLWDGDSWENVRCFTIATPTNEPWINELHYTNGGADANEGFEIAGPSGTDLSDYQIVLYNGANGNEYDTVTLSGIIDNESNNFGALAFTANGNIQNGSPDGIVLYKISTGTVIQFLSYAGVFTANNDVASGVMSTDIGVTEDGGTANTESLQLNGTGNMYTNFTWGEDITQSFGDLNAGQIIN